MQFLNIELFWNLACTSAKSEFTNSDTTLSFRVLAESGGRAVEITEKYWTPYGKCMTRCNCLSDTSIQNENFCSKATSCRFLISVSGCVSTQLEIRNAGTQHFSRQYYGIWHWSVLHLCPMLSVPSKTCTERHWHWQTGTLSPGTQSRFICWNLSA